MKVRVRTVAPGERSKLHAWKRMRSNHVVSLHARVILLSAGGMSNQEIAQSADYSPQWVRRIIHRFNAGGLAAIEWFPCGQTRDSPRKFDTDTVEQIAEVALSSAKALIGLTQWSLSKLCEYLVGQQVIRSISLSWLRILLLRLGIRWRRTKTWKHSNDPQFQAKYRRLRALYSKRPRGGRRICVDEFGPLNLQPRGGACLTQHGHKGVERHRTTYRRKRGVQHYLAAYDLESGELFGQFTNRLTWVEFLAFLKWVRGKYDSEETLHIVLDCYGPHQKQEVIDWASEHNVKLNFTPTNASWLNHIECQFTELRKFALNNSDYETHEQQREAIDSFLDWRNGNRAIAIEPWRGKIRNRDGRAA